MQNFKFAISSILGHKMRAFLTMIGIIIGVASVVVIMALGNGMQQGVTKSITKDQQYVALLYSHTKSNYTMGVHLMEFNGEAETDSEILEEPPVIQEAWVKELLKVDGVKGYYVTNGSSADFSYHNKKSEKVNITGVNATFFKIRKYEILAGRTLLPSDYQSFSNVMMIDETIASTLFGSSSEALNKVVSVGESNYRVVGVYKDPNAGQSMSMSSGSALMANTQVASEFQTDEISTVYVYVPEVNRINEVGVEAAKELTNLSGARQGEYQILNMDSMLEQYKQITGTMTGVIGAIAGISLFVGGIGVMNIMLVSVTERTREIGLRKALGATRGNILTQFLIESMVLTLIGGLLGLGLAYGINALLAAVVPENVFGGPPVVSATAAVGSLIFSAMVGIIFGILPANKASKLDPIEALRYE
ncbi:ABC transporter permease [Streptococcus sp. Marseille-P7376]|uniref:ABC transporter permease n=1 Tax=Streptococcus sp. Marseille-P7376 TaxID=2592044 RepID=UPI0011E78F74|nr:ABC transporter permease [Streptococcus sp. Marseille-P7376]